jgi:hypothetical protein
MDAVGVSLEIVRGYNARTQLKKIGSYNASAYVDVSTFTSFRKFGQCWLS